MEIKNFKSDLTLLLAEYVFTTKFRIVDATLFLLLL